MLTARAPLRVSFFGGGTDYPEYYERHPGAVLGTSIDKYIFISALRLEPFMGHAFRISYRINEEVHTIDEIEHPVFRALLKYYDIEPGWNFSVLSSLPARSGLGSSSSFTVGLVKVLSHIRGMRLTRYDLAQTAIHIERDLLNENVGIQDQLHATFGSLNRYDFASGNFSIRPIRMHHSVRDMLNESMYLIHTGVARFASQVVEEQMQRTREERIDRPLSHLFELTRQACTLLEGDDPEAVLKQFGSMVHDGWMTKRSLASAVSSGEIDQLYDTIIQAGALGGKLCGAGGGGFLFAIVPHWVRSRVQEALGSRALIPIRMDETGATLLNA